MKKTIIDIYADESFHEASNILGIAALFVRRTERKNFLKRIMNSRCLLSPSSEWTHEYHKCSNNPRCKEEWHKNNDAEIHYKDLRMASSYSKKYIAKSWLSLCSSNNGAFGLNISYLDFKKLDLKVFGGDPSNVYNRFFRSTIKYGVKSFFSEDSSVEIGTVYHDVNSSLSQHGFFPNRNLIKLQQELRQVSISNKEIEFIESNHRLYSDKQEKENSNLIQFTDLLLGTIGQNTFNFSNDSFRKEIAMVIRDMLEDILAGAWSDNKKLYHVSCFPKNNLKTECVQNLLGEEFTQNVRGEYYSPSLNMPRYDKKIPSLERWF